jgi:lipopolysaccharide biosynthesis protein
MWQQPMRVLAFYLPQFHPIPENDRWWGKGFTEWTNVATAVPLFPGHYQPHVPADLGFYDLRLAEARRAQASLAREYGIHGFCYYHYWFEGRRLLECPFDEVLSSGEPDFPFCLCWANENWTRAWDGHERDVLVRQEYSVEDDRRHLQWLARAFRDRRYVRVDGKPLFLVYRASRLPDPRHTTSIWREEARKLGVGEVFLCRVESFSEEQTDPSELGFNAAVEFQPEWENLGPGVRRSLLGRLARRLGPAIKRGGDADYRLYDYAAVVERMLQKPDPPYRRFPCVTPSWDNSARRRAEPFILRGSTPDLYERWLTGVLRAGRGRGGSDRLVFVNAWNEWGEGCHLEPDLRSGRGYLEATRRAVAAAGPIRHDAGEGAGAPHPAVRGAIEGPSGWPRAG